MTKKELGQYMTPDKIVKMILDSIGYSGEIVLSAKIMEPSFGEGVFLAEILKRIASESHRQGKSNGEIAEIIKSNVFGIEKDAGLYEKAIHRLNNVLRENGIEEIDWTSNLICGDTLLEYPQFTGKMDFVVGNPPYVRIHNLPEDYRDIMKQFSFSNGMMDLYIIFYEIGLLMLNETGKLGFISPNSFLKNASQKEFRKCLAEKNYIAGIYDFKTSKIFPEADTYTCICLLNKAGSKTVDYREYAMYEVVTQNDIPSEYFTETNGAPWLLCSAEDMAYLKQNQMTKQKLGDIAETQNGIATNRDYLYAIKAFLDVELTKPYHGKPTDKAAIVYFKDAEGNTRRIETGILRRCVKESKFEGSIGNSYMIFPYNPAGYIETISGGTVIKGYCPMAEEELEERYPYAYQYLLSVKDELSTRDMEKNAAWYLFARSQGIQNSGLSKIVFKHIVDGAADTITPYILAEDVIVYSGIFTTMKIENYMVDDKFDDIKYKKDINKLCNAMSSAEFARFCRLVGKDMSGGYKDISTKMVKQWSFKPL